MENVSRKPEIDSEAIPDYVHTVFEFSLPFAIPVPDDLYEIYQNKRRIDLLIKRIQKDVGFSTTNSYMQMQNDKYGRSSFSQICLNFPWKIALREEGRTPIAIGNIPIPPRVKDKEIIVKTLNRFIEVVRYATDAFWVEPVRYQDLLAYQSYYWDGKKTYTGILAIMDTGVGGLRVGNGDAFYLEPEKLSKLNSFLYSETVLDSASMLLLNAKEACLEENHRLATIEAVAGLEVVLSNFIKVRGKELKLPNKALKDFMIKVGLTGNLTLVLKMLTAGVEQVDDGILNECTGVITVRNEIMHEGLLEVEATVTEKRILAIEKMIDYLKRITSATATP